MNHTGTSLVSGDTEVLHCTSICDYYQWCELAPVINTSKLSVISINIRSLASKFAELCAQLTRTKNKFTFVVIVETWLTKEKDRALELQGYKSHSICRNNRIGGGVKVYYLEHLNVNILHEFTGINDYCESIALCGYITGFGKLNLICVYRPPGKPFNSFITYLGTLLENVVDGKSIVVSDINIDVISTSDPNTMQYVEVMCSYGFVNEINLPTYRMCHL